MRKPVFMVLSVLATVVWLQGCETIKGVSKGSARGAQTLGSAAAEGAKNDISNVGKHIENGVDVVTRADKKFEEKYW